MDKLTSFKQLVQRWKSGEPVYQNGRRILPTYETGKLPAVDQDMEYIVQPQDLDLLNAIEKENRIKEMYKAAPWFSTGRELQRVYGDAPQEPDGYEYHPMPNTAIEPRDPYLNNGRTASGKSYYDKENWLYPVDIVPYDTKPRGTGKGKKKSDTKKRIKVPEDVTLNSDQTQNPQVPVDENVKTRGFSYIPVTEEQYYQLPRQQYNNTSSTMVPVTTSVREDGTRYTSPRIAGRFSDVAPSNVISDISKQYYNQINGEPLLDEKGRELVQELYEVAITPKTAGNTRSERLARQYNANKSNDMIAKEQQDAANESAKVSRAMHNAGASLAPYWLSVFNPLGFASAVVGGDFVNEITKEFTRDSGKKFSNPVNGGYNYDGWGDWVSDKTGLDPTLAEFTNPGYLLGGWTQMKAGPRIKGKVTADFFGDEFGELGGTFKDKFKFNYKTPLVPNIGFSYAGTEKAIDSVNADGTPHYKDVHTTQAPSLRRIVFGDKNSVGYVKYRDKNGLLQGNPVQQYTWDGVPLQERTGLGKKLDSFVHDAKIKIFGKDGDIKSLVKESIGDDFSTVKESVNKLLDKVFGEDFDTKTRNKILDSADRHTMSEFVDAEGNVNVDAFTKFLEGIVDEAKLVEKNIRKKTAALPTGMLPSEVGYNGGKQVGSGLKIKRVPTTAKEFIESIINKEYRAKPGHSRKYTNLYQHTFDVANSAKDIPLPKGVSRQELTFAALMHDIGKVFGNELHGENSAKIITNRFSNVGDNVITAINDHMSTELYEGDPFTKALHFADVARGLGYDEAAAVFPDLLNYDRTITGGTSKKFNSVKEQIEQQINPIFESYGYDPIDTTLPEQQMIDQYLETVRRHRTLLRGVNDPGEPVIPDDSKLVHGSPEWYTAHMKYELQKEVAETLNRLGLPNTPENRLKVAAEVIPNNPTPNGRKGMYKRRKDPEKKQILYSKTTSKGKPSKLGNKLGLRPDREQGAYMATDKAVVELYANDLDGGKVGTGRAKEGGVFKVTKPEHPLKSGQTLGENWLENDYAAYGSYELYLDRRPLHDTYMYDNPYRVQTGRSLESDMRAYDPNFPRSGSKEAQKAYLTNYRNKIKFMRSRGVKPAYEMPGFNQDVWFDDRIYTSEKTNHPHLGSSVKNEGPRTKKQLRRPQYGHFVVKPGVKEFNAERVDLSKRGAVNKLMKQVTRKN